MKHTHLHRHTIGHPHAQGYQILAEHVHEHSHVKDTPGHQPPVWHAKHRHSEFDEQRLRHPEARR